MAIEISNLCFAYKKDLVLKNVTTTISEGDFVAFVGPNGSGKSTLIRCLDGILTPQKGTIMLNGKSLQQYGREELAKVVAYVPQHEGNISSTSVYDTVLMGRKPHIGWSPKKNDHAVVIKMLKMLDLDDIALNYISELSGGQRQRVFIARALAQEPSILLLDEPTSNLDLKHTLEVLSLLKQLSEKEITVIIAIHDLNLAARFCNTIIMIHNGERFAEGGKEIMTASNIKKLYDVDVEVIEMEDQIIFIPKL